MIITFHSQLIQLLSYLEKDETDYNIDCDSPNRNHRKNAGKQTVNRSGVIKNFRHF